MASYTSKSEENVVRHLMQLFGDQLDLEIIQSVALSCQFDPVASTNALKEMYSNVLVPEINKKGKTRGHHSNDEKNTKHSRHGLLSLRSHAAHGSAVHKSSEKERKLDELLQTVKNGTRVLILMRGLPGSGKSYLAKKVVAETVGGNYYKDCILSTDDYFITSRGMYKYDVSKLQEAHACNQRRAFQAMQRGVSPVIIDNTNTQMWEMKAYVALAVTFSYDVKILEPFTHWAFNDKELARKNSHGVPRIKIKEMIERYEKNITPEAIMSSYSLRYQPGRSAQRRSFPPFNLQGKHPQINQLEIPKQHKNRVEPTAPDTKGTLFAWESNAQNYDYVDLTNCAQNFPDKIYSSKISSDDSSRNEMSIDDILMCGLQENTAEVLQPNFSQSNKVYPDLNLEEAWGISEKAMVSWDIVTPISDTKPNNVEIIKISPTSSEKIEYKDACTNTCSMEFVLLNNNNFEGVEYERIMYCTSRDISNGLISPLLAPPQKITVHKSTMTDEITEFIDMEVKSKASDIRQLMSLFPVVPVDALNDMYEKCKGDMNWIVDLLIDDNQVSINTDVNETNEENINDVVNNRNPVNSKNPFLTAFEEISGAVSSSFQNLMNPPVNKKSNSGGSSFEEVETANEATESDDFDDFEYVQNGDNNECNDEQETVELNLGDGLIGQLESKFGDSSLFCPKGFKPVVQIPTALARQIYTFYIESVYQQMENDMIKTDEEFARKLEEQEHQNIVTIRAANTASSSQDCQQQNQWRNLSPDDIATKLTKQKLVSSFPSVDVDQLYEIYRAHNNDYKETVNVLLASTNPEGVNKSDKKLFEPPITETIVNEMKQMHTEVKQIADAMDDSRPAQSYRDDAFTFLEKREELYQKAQAAYQKGMTQVAQFYSDLAQQQTKLYDQANNMAAAAFLNEHSERHKNFDTIDLHFLFVKEAIAALDIFIDRNINLLQGDDKKIQYLFVITGRGKRSENGKSKLKPAVISRLKKRKINYCHLNPGLLKIKVMQESLVTTDV